MMSSINSSLSALVAFSKKMQVTANNVANVYSDGFKKSRTVLTEGPNNSVQVEIDQIKTKGPIVNVQENDETKQKELSNVDLAEEFPQAILTQRNYEANLKIFKTEDEMLGSVIDMIS